MTERYAHCYNDKVWSAKRNAPDNREPDIRVETYIMSGENGDDVLLYYEVCPSIQVCFFKRAHSVMRL